MREPATPGDRSAASTPSPRTRSAPLRLGSLALLAGAATTPAAAAQDATYKPWRLGEAIGTPEWFSIKGALETRYESLDKRLRSGETGSNQGIFHRTLLELSVRRSFLEVTGELIDARIFDEPNDARTTTGQVNALELLQGYVAGKFTDALAPGDTLRVQVGRHTMNVGSRRFAARNVYRNTINAFTGVNAVWTADEKYDARLFYVLPVQRLPGNGDIPALRDNEVEFDEETRSKQFFGGILGIDGAVGDTRAEFYGFGVHDRDSTDFLTRDRELLTFGTRWVRKPQRGQTHWEWESAYQFGESHTGASSTTDLDHEAHFHHLTFGWTLANPSSTRIEGLFDYVSGDKDPNDDENNRFDTLYGVPRPEFGPTGIFRAVTRANLVSPGVRVVLNPADKVNLMLMWRRNFLASDTDAWTTAALRDPDGESGSHIGDLSEMRIRYDVLPKSWRLELGVAYHAAGDFAKNAPGGEGKDALFGYLHTSFWF